MIELLIKSTLVTAERSCEIVYWDYRCIWKNVLLIWERLFLKVYVILIILFSITFTLIVEGTEFLRFSS